MCAEDTTFGLHETTRGLFPLLALAIELAGSMRGANPDIIGIGRDLHYATRCVTPDNAGEQARYALLAALKALDESGGND